MDRLIIFSEKGNFKNYHPKKKNYPSESQQCGLGRCSARDYITGLPPPHPHPMTLGVIKAVFVDMTPTSWAFTKRS